MLMSISEAFEKFRSNLEPTNTERSDASRRQQTIRSQMAADMDVDDSFLTGSYARNTAVRPLKDVDIMIVLGDGEYNYLEERPGAVLERVRDVLAPLYPGRVSLQARSVTVEFGVKVVNDVSDKVVAVDVVPAFREGNNYRIADSRVGQWMLTNPKVHQQMATRCNADLGQHWIPLVKMLKKANSYAAESRIDGKPVKPNFLIEVMAHSLVAPPWTGPYSLELRAFLASAADLLDQRWPDPAKLGPDVSERLHNSQSELQQAREWLRDTVAQCDLALRQARNGQVGAALATWQRLFGPLFVKSK